MAAADPPPADDPAPADPAPAPDYGPPPVVNLSVDPDLPRNEYDRAYITEGDSVTITATLSKAAPAAGLTVRLFILDGFAADFIAQDDQGIKDVVVAGGATTATFTVPTVNDDRDERGTYIYIYLRHDDAYELGDDYFMEVFVEDND